MAGAHRQQAGRQTATGMQADAVRSYAPSQCDHKISFIILYVCGHAECGSPLYTEYRILQPLFFEYICQMLI